MMKSSTSDLRAIRMAVTRESARVFCNLRRMQPVATQCNGLWAAAYKRAPICRSLADPAWDHLSGKPNGTVSANGNSRVVPPARPVEAVSRETVLRFLALEQHVDRGVSAEFPRSRAREEFRSSKSEDHGRLPPSIHRERRIEQVRTVRPRHIS